MNSGALKRDLRKCNQTAIWLCGGITAVTALIVRLWAGSPHPLLHALDADGLIPPIWLMGLFWLLGSFLFGCTCGASLSCRGGPAQSAWRFQGGMYFLLSVFCISLWYPLLFRVEALWLSWLILALAIATAVMCALCWMRVLRLSLIGCGLYIIWLTVLFMIQLVVMLH